MAEPSPLLGVFIDSALAHLRLLEEGASEERVRRSIDDLESAAELLPASEADAAARACARLREGAGEEELTELVMRLRASEPHAEEALSPDDYAALRRFFRDEAEEELEEIIRVLSGPARGAHLPLDVLDDVLRRLHSLKGSAGTVGLPHFSEAAHDVEECVARVRRSGGAWPAGLGDRVIEAVDLMHGAALTDEQEAQAALAAVRDQLAAATALATGAPAPARVPAPPAGAVTTPLREERRTSGRRREDARVLRVDPARVDQIGEQLAQLRRDHQHLIGLADEIAATTDSAAALQAGLREAQQDLGALERGIARLRRQNARALFQLVAAQVRAMARAAGKRVRLYTWGDETELEKSMAEQLADPLVQLLRNAVAHGIEAPGVRVQRGKPEEGRVTLGARVRDGKLLLEVSDDGGGIAAEAIRARMHESGLWSPERSRAATSDELTEAIFEAGVSSRQSADQLAGRGYGLDFVRRAVIALGGEARVRSTPGEGTTFTLNLPVEKTFALTLPLQAGSDASAGEVAPRGRILVAEDSRSQREAVARSLEGAGYRVDRAVDGKRAWQLLAELSYDYLVTDLEMPNMGGLELIERVRNSHPLRNLPVIIISSRLSPMARQRAAALQVVACLEKPVATTRLLELVAGDIDPTPSP